MSTKPVAAQSRDIGGFYERRGKRALDVFGASVGLILSAPLILVIAIVVRLTSPGPAIFEHERVGLGGRPFRLYKFRSMRDGQGLEHEDLARFHERFKLQDDPRVTRVGDFLRKYSLDELPQLWNVLVGDMSLVGPRPVVRSELESMYPGDGVEILRIRPGLTGLWQVSGRSELTYPERVELDLRYVRECGLRMDLWLLLRTPLAVVSRRGAC